MLLYIDSRVTSSSLLWAGKVVRTIPDRMQMAAMCRATTFEYGTQVLMMLAPMSLSRTALCSFLIRHTKHGCLENAKPVALNDPMRFMRRQAGHPCRGSRGVVKARGRSLISP